MIKRIDLIMPIFSQYGVLHHFTRCLHQALINAGVNARLLETEKYNPAPFLTKIFSDPPECTLSFNGILPDEQGHFLCDLLKIPHVSCLVDSHNQYLELTKSKNNIITCVDRHSCEFFKGMNFDNVLFMPHAVEKDLKPSEDEHRNYEVLLLSSSREFELIRTEWDKKYPSDISKAMLNAADIYLSDTETTYVQALATALDSLKSKSIAKRIAEYNPVEMLYELEQYTRGLDRVRLVQSIKDARVDIFGTENTKEFWNKYLGKKQRNVILHEGVSFQQSFELMKHAKIVLNNCIWIKDGAHERIFSGMACGALVMTSDNRYLREYFTDGKNILFYNPSEMESTNDKINQALSNEKKLKQMAKQGREIVMKYHTWDQRAGQLLKDLEPILNKMKKSQSS